MPVNPRALLIAAGLLCLAFTARAQTIESALEPRIEMPAVELPDLASITFRLGLLSATELKRRMAPLLGCTWTKEAYFPTTCSNYLVELSIDKDNAPLLRMTYENPSSNGTLGTKDKDDRARVIAVAGLLASDSSRTSAWLTVALDESRRGTLQSSMGILDGANPVWALVCRYHPLGDAVPENGYTDVFFTSNPTYIVGGCGQ